MEGRAVGHNFERGLPKDHPSSLRGKDLNVKFTTDAK
jgi:hypothetical protein